VRKEALVRDTCVRMKGGVVVEGSGMGFGGNVKWPDYKVRFHSFGGGGWGLFTVSRAMAKDRELRHKVDLDHVPKVFREPIRGFHDLPRQKATLSVHIVWVEFNLNGIYNNAIHISVFHGEDGRIVEMNAVSLVDTVFSYG
jgi:hypothetical protein